MILIVIMFNLTLLTIKFFDYFVAFITLFIVFGLAYAFMTNLFTPSGTRKEFYNSRPTSDD